MGVTLLIFGRQDGRLFGRQFEQPLHPGEAAQFEMAARPANRQIIFLPSRVRKGASPLLVR
jgi:hypothetical protein